MSEDSDEEYLPSRDFQGDVYDIRRRLEAKGRPYLNGAKIRNNNIRNELDKFLSMIPLPPKIKSYKPEEIFEQMRILMDEITTKLIGETGVFRAKHTTLCYALIKEACRDSPFKTAVLRFMDAVSANYEKQYSSVLHIPNNTIEAICDELPFDIDPLFFVPERADIKRIEEYVFSTSGYLVAKVNFEHFMAALALMYTTGNLNSGRDAQTFTLAILQKINESDIIMHYMIYHLFKLLRIRTYIPKWLGNRKGDIRNGMLSVNQFSYYYKDVDKFGDIRCSLDPKSIQSHLSISPRIIDTYPGSNDVLYYNFIPCQNLIKRQTEGFMELLGNKPWETNPTIENILDILYEADIVLKNTMIKKKAPHEIYDKHDFGDVDTSLLMGPIREMVAKQVPGQQFGKNVRFIVWREPRKKVTIIYQK